MASEPRPERSKLRPLLPTPPTSTSNNAPVVSHSSASRDVPVVRKRSAVTTACGPCRKRKARCDGKRPTCNPCKARNSECEYDRPVGETQYSNLKRKYEELQSHRTPYAVIFDQLRSRPPADVEAIVRKIRRGEDCEDIARDLEYGDLLIQSSLAPETRYRYEFPLSPKIPAYLVRQSSPYLNSLIYEWTSPSAIRETTSSSLVSQSQPDAAASELYAPYLKPYHAAEIIDTQLNTVVPSKWTTVCSDDALMKKLLEVFLLQDHDWWTAFHKDYFLQDMAEMRHEFCSPLLVNTVLAMACNYYHGISDRAEFWNPKTLGYRFLAEARRLQDYELQQDKITNIQAALILHVIYSAAGSDKIGFAYTIRACAAAHNIGLFQPASASQNTRQSIVRNYTAWALYSWQSLMCFHYFRPPLIEKPPDFALPDPQEDPSWYGEIWLKYPSRTKLYPSNSAGVFKARAEFAVILNDVGQRLFGNPGPSPGLPAVEVAEFYSKFKSWYGSLTDSLTPQMALLPSHLKLHMHYFQVLVKLLQSPSLSDGEGLEKRANLVNLFGQLPHQIVLHAKGSLEILLRAYYLRHGFDYLDTYLVSLLLETCLVAIDEIRAPHRKDDISALQSTIILLAKGIYEQGQSFFLGQLVLQLIAGKMRPEDLEMLKHFITDDSVGSNKALRLEQVQMEWPVDIQSMADNPESKRLGHLMRQLKETSLIG